MGLNLEREAWAVGRDLQHKLVKHIPLPSQPRKDDITQGKCKPCKEQQVEDKSPEEP